MQGKLLLFLFVKCFQASYKRPLMMEAEIPEAILLILNYFFLLSSLNFFPYSLSQSPQILSTGYFFPYFNSLLSYVSDLFVDSTKAFFAVLVFVCFLDLSFAFLFSQVNLLKYNAENQLVLSLKYSQCLVGFKHYFLTLALYQSYTAVYKC